MNNKTFNIIITGVGGQGLITLLQIIDEAAFAQGFDVKSSELHGLSQRGGSVEAHIRFGKKVFSPLVSNGKADLIMALEVTEGLRESLRAGKNTKILVNEYLMPFEGSLKIEEAKNYLSDISKGNLYMVKASEICKEKLQNEVVSTIYLLGRAIRDNLIPLRQESVSTAIKSVIPEKYRDINLKALQLAND